MSIYFIFLINFSLISIQKLFNYYYARLSMLTAHHLQLIIHYFNVHSTQFTFFNSKSCLILEKYFGTT